MARLLLTTAILTACAATGAGQEVSFSCEIDGPGVALPAEIDEASGVGWSARHPGILWVMNDGRSGVVFAVDTTGALRGRIQLQPTDVNRIWDAEDMAVGQCGDAADAESCIWLADIGDNYQIRDSVSVFVTPEPALLSDDAVVEPASFHALRPEPIDAETLLLGSGRSPLYVLTKGNDKPPSLLRWPGELRADTLVSMEEVHRLQGDTRSLQDQFTGGSQIPGRDRWMVRTYSWMAVYEIRDGLLLEVAGTRTPLGPLREPQGEAIAARADGRVVLASESGPFGSRGGLSFVRCEGWE